MGSMFKLASEQASKSARGGGASPNILSLREKSYCRKRSADSEKVDPFMYKILNFIHKWPVGRKNQLSKSIMTFEVSFMVCLHQTKFCFLCHFHFVFKSPNQNRIAVCAFLQRLRLREIAGILRCFFFNFPLSFEKVLEFLDTVQRTISQGILLIMVQRGVL